MAAQRGSVIEEVSSHDDEVPTQERGAVSALDVIRGIHGRWMRPSRGWPAVTWAVSRERVHMVPASKPEYPCQRLQLLRVLAWLVALFPSEAETGYSVEEHIVPAGCALYPGSPLFMVVGDMVSYPTTKLVVAKISSKQSDGLQGRGEIRCCSVAVKRLGKKPPRNTFSPRLTRTLVVLTANGAEAALRDGWVPPMPHQFKTLLARASAAMNLGLIKLG